MGAKMPTRGLGIVRPLSKLDEFEIECLAPGYWQFCKVAASAMCRAIVTAHDAFFVSQEPATEPGILSAAARLAEARRVPIIKCANTASYILAVPLFSPARMTRLSRFGQVLCAPSVGCRSRILGERSGSYFQQRPDLACARACPP
eukprot:SAG11_NODE_57_length_19200_cov_18.288417_2_plen_146_part_00